MFIIEVVVGGGGVLEGLVLTFLKSISNFQRPPYLANFKWQISEYLLSPCSVGVLWLSSSTPAAAFLFPEVPPSPGQALPHGCSHQAQTQTSPRTGTEWLGWNAALGNKRPLCPLSPTEGGRRVEYKWADWF